MFKNMPKIVSIPLLLLFIVALYVSLNKLIVPFVMQVVESDLFFSPDDEQEELGKIRNERTNVAFSQCKDNMKTDKHVPENAQFSEADYEAWALGGKVYLIRSHVLVNAEGAASDRKYACKIKFAGGDVTDNANWSVLAVDFHGLTD
jgi:hypothetical protein